MGITTKNTGIACAAVFLLVMLGYFIYQFAGDKALHDANGDPLLPMPFHSAGVGATIKIIDASDLLREFQNDKDKARLHFSNTVPVWLNGTVTDMSGPTVTLDGPNGVDCVYVSTSEQARLHIGQKATIEGFLHGGNPIALFRPWKKRL